MLTGIARLALVAEALAYGAIGWWLSTRHDWSLAAIVGAALVTSLALRAAFVAGSMALSAHAAGPQARDHRLRIDALARLFACETWILAKCNYFRIPLESLALPPEPVPAADDRLPVILVHGYFGNRGYWAGLHRRLRESGFSPLFAPNFSSTFATIEHFAEELHREIERVSRDSGHPMVVLVCHSMGGLAARRYLADHGADRLARLVTIASPHRGTALAAYGAGPNARQMHAESEFLRQLERDERGPRAWVPFTSIYSLHDNLVCPREGCRHEAARNVALAGLGHMQILEAPELFEMLAEELRAAGAGPR